jgi:hypothetical protein
MSINGRYLIARHEPKIRTSALESAGDTAAADLRRGCARYVCSKSGCWHWRVERWRDDWHGEFVGGLEHEYRRHGRWCAAGSHFTEFENRWSSNCAEHGNRCSSNDARRDLLAAATPRWNIVCRAGGRQLRLRQHRLLLFERLMGVRVVRRW